MSIVLSAVLLSLAQGAEVQLDVYSPSPAHPFGTPHADSAPQLAQFAFMIGEFDCVDEILQEDGTWKRSAAIWNASYFLNGRAIQDRYWSDEFATTNVRMFDEDLQAWRVNFARTPANKIGHGQWIGQQIVTEDGPTMVMWSGSPDGKDGSRLTFSEIRSGGFEWIAESVLDDVATPTWRSSCRRRTHGRELVAPLFMGNDASAVHPFGRIHPDAPQQLESLEFIIGSFAARSPSRVTLEATRAAYILNGWAVQQDVFEPEQASARIMFFDKSLELFVLSEFEMPGARWTVWHGAPSTDGIRFTEKETRDATPPTDRTFELRSADRSDHVSERSTLGSDRVTTRRFSRLR